MVRGMSLAALLVATPIFGFSLSLDPSLVTGPSMAGVVAVQAMEEAEEEAAEADDGRPRPATLAEQMQQRGRISKFHRWLGIATWASMTLTVLLGIFQWRNLYGARELGDTPCVQGDAIFGMNACVRQPVPHLVSSILTTSLYTVTFGLSLRMPDPMNLSEGDSEYARNLRRHKRLRWVHVIGMIAQQVLGVVITNADSFGLSRANDYGTLRALSTIHFAIGMVTYGALTWAGVIFAF